MMRKNNGVLIIIAFLFLFSACSSQQDSEKRNYRHTSYTSSIDENQCCLCSETASNSFGSCFGQDNLCIVHLNTLEALCVEINRYDINGEQIKEATGTIQFGSIGLGHCSLCVEVHKEHYEL